MSNTNLQVNHKIRSTAALRGIYGAIEEIYEIAGATLDGKITKQLSPKTGRKYQSHSLTKTA